MYNLLSFNADLIEIYRKLGEEDKVKKSSFDRINSFEMDYEDTNDEVIINLWKEYKNLPLISGDMIRQINIFKEILDYCKVTYGVEHFYTGFSLYNLAQSYVEVGMVDKTVELLNDSYNILLKKYGEKHEKVMRVLYFLNINVKANHHNEPNT